MNSDGSAPLDTLVNRILKSFRNFPVELTSQMPVLTDIANSSAGLAGGGELRGTLLKRLERRYARICVVQSELNKLNFREAKPGTGFDDFVFQQTNFDIYKQIGAENFKLFFIEGLEDYSESFYKKRFMMDRRNLKALIDRSYHPEGEFFFCKTLNREINPLLLSIVRTLHTSLEFLPLIGKEELYAECASLIRFLRSCSAIDEEAAVNLDAGFPSLFGGLLRALDGATVTHSDTMTTILSVKTENGKPVLYGTFRPRNKAFTVALVTAD
jgi:hypothetical protein